MNEINSHIVFDLDDTIYKEEDFVRSAYNYIANYLQIKHNHSFFYLIDKSIRENTSLFDNIIEQDKINFSLDKYLELYRFHFPNIFLELDTIKLFQVLMKQNIKFSIITDGRSISQRNKIVALGLEKQIKNIIVSEETGYEKPNEFNFKLMESYYPNDNFVYVGDNPSKDFYSPNVLGWDTVCLLDNGRNIHKQSFKYSREFLPKRKINSLIDLLL